RGADQPSAPDLPARSDRSRATIVTAILTVQGLEKRFGTRRVLAGASFAVHERDRIGMIGANGAGKSTLLEIVVHCAMGGDDPTFSPDAGLVTWKRDLVLEYVAQEPSLGAATVGEVVARPGVADHEIATIADALELPPLAQPIATLSLGERRRVALARALAGRADRRHPRPLLPRPRRDPHPRGRSRQGLLLRRRLRRVHADPGRAAGGGGRGRVPARRVHPPRDRLDPARATGA